MLPPFPPPSSPIIEALALRLVDPGLLDAVARQPDPLQSYELRVGLQDSRLTEMLRELRTATAHLPTCADLTEARIWVKFYFVTWCSLSDVLAALIAEVFDLGIDSRDLDLTMVLRNRHVRASALPAVLSKYSTAIAYPKYSERRNDIVHRGYLDDNEFLEFDRAAILEAMKRHFHRPSSVTDEAVAAKLGSILTEKKAAYDAHLFSTELMLAEMFVVLSALIATHPRAGAV